jgi:energy-coupling factor transporter ATP-binding protein EcfA2
MYVDKVRLRDVRAIASATVTLTHPTAEAAANLELPNFNLVLGTNGSGKSSVLSAIAAALTVDIDGENLPGSARTWPRIGGDSDALIQLRIASSDADDIESDIRLEIGRNGLSPEVRWLRVRGTISDDQFVAAYGPVRRTDAGGDFYDVPAGRLHMLFDDTPLASIESMLSSTDRPAEAVEILNTLLPDDIRCRPEPDDAGRWFAQRGIPLPVSALSDGVQSFLAWVGDLMYRLEFTDGGFTDTPGIVLVDEVDQRLHPQWQQFVHSRLGTTFPRLQFIVTAHSPLLPSALRRENLLLVEPDPDRLDEGATIVHRLDTEEVYGRTADQVLESSYFQVPSSRSEPFWEELRAFATQAQDPDAGHEPALEFMRRLADPDRRQSSDQ